MSIDMARHTWWFKEFLQELKCYFHNFGILAVMPSCQGHVLLAGSKVKGTGPWILARGTVPTGGHDKGRLLPEFKKKKKRSVITTCILKQFFTKFRLPWKLETFYAYFHLEKWNNHDYTCQVFWWGGARALESDTWIQIMSLALTICMILGTLFNCFMTQFLYF